MQDRGRFDSYPLRQFIFDFRFLIFDWPQMLADRIEHQTSGKEVETCRVSKFAS